MGVVTQETQLFASTIEENIAYGLDGYTQQDLEEAAQQAHAMSFISALPEGFSTLVGERGVKLSGGQRQRLAIARLLIRKPKVTTRISGGRAMTMPCLKRCEC
jgi:ABC-type multidrug transport system fused ATPase/permease subunit